MPKVRFTSSNKVKLRIASQLEASKQFLVILIGLSVANAVAEKLKYSFYGSALGLRAVSSDNGSYLLPPKVLIDEDDNLFGLLFTGAHYLDFIILSVFLIYVTRFFFNNYTYLSEYYGESAIAEIGNEEKSLRALKRASTYDLALSVITGVIMCLISMVTHS